MQFAIENMCRYFSTLFTKWISNVPTRCTYLLTPWCRVLLEKLNNLQLLKKFPAFHGSRRFITALTSVRHLSLSWASPIQSIYPHPTSRSSVDALISQIYFWNKTLHVSDSPSVYYQEFFTVHTAVVYVIQVSWQLASRIRTEPMCTVKNSWWWTEELSA